MSDVRANATVDVLKPATPTTIGHFRVEVWGLEPYDYVRKYDIMARNETTAAQQGIKKFVAEMNELPPQNGN